MPNHSTTSDDARVFLLAHLGYDVGPVELVGEGWWSRCFGFRDGDRDFVIRFGREVDDFYKDQRAGALASATLPVPQVLEVGEALDAYFAISTRAYGTDLESLDYGGWRAVLPAFFAALDALRDIAPPDGTGYGIWNSEGRAPYASWREFLVSVERDTPERHTHGWRQRLIDSPVGDASFVAGLDALRELAEGLTPCRSVAHADLINRNVLVDGNRITAVFDWGCALYGDFLYDIAWLAFWEPWYAALTELDIRSHAREHYAAIGLDVPDFDARIHACMLHIGLDHHAWNAITGDYKTLARVAERTMSLLD